jgi:aminopeptidase N
MCFKSSVRFLITLSTLLGLACGDDGEVEVVAGVPWSLAEHRARTISDVRYNISFDIPAELSERIRGHMVVSFTLSDVAEPLVLDFAQSGASVLAVRMDGEAVPYRVVNEHIVVSRGVFHEGENALELEFLAGDGSLNRNEDFLFTLFVPDRARVAFPCFDQPNLKARYTLRLETPASWRAVANEAVQSHQIAQDRATFTFNETPPLSTYLFAFAAGVFEVETAQRGGRTLTMYHRETDRGKLARNREAIFDLHGAALDWLEAYTGIAYPFEKFGFVLIPAFQYGGMEHPGGILYRAAGLLLDETATQNQLLARASVIAHETAHMWFGDLVTMNWFDDVWTKEVFANFMAAKIVNPSFPEIDHDLRFLLAHYPAAYEVDRTAGANPIRQQLDNLNEAGTLYGAIIYQKAPIVMKHLERLVGETTFRDGLREYLETFRFANATWPALIDILDRRSREDLAAWSGVWVEEPGRPTIVTELEIADGRIASLRLRQTDPRGEERTWTQRLELLLGYDGSRTRSVTVQLGGASVNVSEAIGLPAPQFVLANGRGVGYGGFELDPRSRRYLLNHLPDIDQALVRGVAWLALWDATISGEIPPLTLMHLAERSLESENDEQNIQRILSYLRTAFWRYLPAGQREELAQSVEALLWRRLGRTPRKTLKAAYFSAYRDVVLTTDGLARLKRIWQEKETIPGLTLSERDYTAMALELAVREVDSAEVILREQLDRITNRDRKARFAFVLPAVSADPLVRDRFFESLSDPKNREHEPWVLQALGYLHQPLRAERSERYIRPSLDMLEEIQRTGDIFFPKRWLDATLGGHSSSSAAAVVRQFLEDRPDLPIRLEGKLLQSADPLFRAAQILDTGGR